jgi:murein L,D-transpeptidase YafK
VTRAQALKAISAERDRQQAKWAGPHAWGHGDCSGDGVPTAVKLAVLAEEFGEVARAFLDGDQDGFQCEITQVAAVACAILEST